MSSDFDEEAYIAALEELLAIKADRDKLNTHMRKELLQLEMRLRHVVKAFEKLGVDMSTLPPELRTTN